MTGIDRFCPRCGEPVEEGARFCGSCGEAFADMAAWTPTPRRRRWLVWVLGAVVAVAVVAFGIVLTSLSATEVTVSVGPEGGRVTLEDNFALVLPPGALASESVVAIRRAEEPPESVEGAAPVGAAYEVDLGGAQLLETVTLEMTYDPEKLPGPGAVVFAAFYDEETREWEVVPAVADGDRHVIEVETTHLSRWRPWAWIVRTFGFLQETTPDAEEEDETSVSSLEDLQWRRLPHDDAVFGEAQMRFVTAGGSAGLVAVGVDLSGGDFNAAMWTSADGVSWSRVPHDEAVFGGSGSLWQEPSLQEISAVTAGGPGLVAVGLDYEIAGGSVAAVWTSSDGMTWSRMPHSEIFTPGFASSTEGNAGMRAVTTGGPGLVAVGEGVWISADGVSWARSSVPDGCQIMRGVTAEGPGLVTVGHVNPDPPTDDEGCGSSVAAVWTSPDGDSWTRVPHDDAIFGRSSGPQYPYSHTTMSAVTAGGPGLVAVGSDCSPSRECDASVWTSPDGVSWSRVPHDEAVFGNASISSVTNVGQGLVAVGSDLSGEGFGAGVWVATAGGATADEAEPQASLSREEEELIRHLEDSLGRFPVRDRQDLQTFPVLQSAEDQLFDGLLWSLSSLCTDAWGDGRVREETTETLCAAANLAANRVREHQVGFVANAVMQTALSTVSPYTLWGKAVLGASRVGAEQVLGNRSTDQMARTVAEQIVAAQFNRLVGAYLADPLAAVTVEQIESVLRNDEVVQVTASERVRLRGRDWVEASVWASYNPHTHSVVAYLGTDANDNLHVVYYEADDRARPRDRIGCSVVAPDGTAQYCFPGREFR